MIWHKIVKSLKNGWDIWKSAIFIEFGQYNDGSCQEFIGIHLYQSDLLTFRYYISSLVVFWRKNYLGIKNCEIFWRNIWKSAISTWFGMDNDDFFQEFQAILRPCIFNNYELINIPKIEKKSKISTIFKLCKRRN